MFSVDFMRIVVAFCNVRLLAEVVVVGSVELTEDNVMDFDVFCCAVVVF